MTLGKTLRACAAIMSGCLAAAALGLAACDRLPSGTIRLEKLGLDEEERLSADAANPGLPALGEEYFLVVTDLGTCLECKRAAIALSRVWKDDGRPGRLVFLDMLRTQLDREATKQFIAEKGLRGVHYLCDARCVERLTSMMTIASSPPAHYFVGTDGLVHWMGGDLPAFHLVLSSIRRGKHDNALTYPLQALGLPLPGTVE